MATPLSPDGGEPTYAAQQAAKRFDIIAIEAEQAAAALRKQDAKLARAKLMPLIGRLSALAVSK